MKARVLFWILAVTIFGSLAATGLVLEKWAFFAVEFVAALSLVLFILLYKRLVKPFQILLNSTELLRQQDFSSRLRHVNNTEANLLIDIFNRMMAQLKEERLLVRERNEFLDLLVKASPQGVVILDFDDRISEINPAGMKMLGITDISNVRGKLLKDTDGELALRLGELESGGKEVVRTSGTAIYRCIRSSFIDKGFDHPFILIEELTHELMRMEKESYERIIRMMSHEVNNSIGAIGSTLHVVSDVLCEENDSHFADVIPAVKASAERCGHLGQFISNLADVVRIPLPVLADVTINELAKSVDALTGMERRYRDIELTMELDPDDATIRADGIQLEQVLVNIVKNGCEAIGNGGHIKITTCSATPSITVEDDGPGIPADAQQKLFSPFYTTKPDGQGIGLMFVREVLINHNAGFRLHSEGGTTKFEILFNP